MLYALTQYSGVYKARTTTAVPVSTRIVAGEQTLYMKTWPNPASDKLQLSMEHGEQGPYSIVVSDLNGRTVLRQQPYFTDQTSETHILDLSFLPVGSYRCEIISLDSGNRFSTAVQILR